MQELTEEKWREVGGLVRQLLSSVARLEEIFEGRKFTLDGHLVGSIGEVIAAHMFDLKLLPQSAKVHDAETQTGRKVQVKLTQGNQNVMINHEPDYLIVMRLDRHSLVLETIYNGPGGPAWEIARPWKGGNQRYAALGKLRTLNHEIAEMDRVALVREIDLAIGGA